jgi:hypothetical protein
MNLCDHFDAVVMLTWSDWKSEPRSNRYHYASRFAKTLPVLFLQHCYQKRKDIQVTKSEVKNIDIVQVSCGLSDQNVADIKSLLAMRGIKRPLIWIYDSMNYQLLLDGLPRAYRVYHATEDYLLETKGWNQGMGPVGNSVIRVLSKVDFMVACSPGVANSCLTTGGYVGPYAVIENGCDAEFLLDYVDRYQPNASITTSPVAIFQGGINQRLDYALIYNLVRGMPDWEFRFCGAAVESEAWKQLLLQPNIRYLGAIHAEEVARHMCESTVGIIPYIQDQWIRNSFPLKAYEYVACGLPVVTVPITALERDANLIVAATTAETFAEAIRSSSNSRYDLPSLQARRQAALANSYDKRFASMCEALLEAKSALSNSRKKLRVAMFYDCMISMHVSTIREHLEAFDRYSQHAVTYIPATPEFWNRPSEEIQEQVDLSIFDVAIIHFSTRLSVREHFDEGLAKAFEAFNGLKVLFIQDEYEGTEIARSWMDRLKFDIVYTCVPEKSIDLVYPHYRFPATEFLPTLTGYVPEDPMLERYARPLEKRNLLIAYRGRKLPAIYGSLGFEKYRIGVEMKIFAEMRGLPVDIEVDDAKRIYGSAWYEFLGSARATLGTESGANIFDFDGSLKAKIARLQLAYPDITFKEIAAKVLDGHEGRIQMNQISPKIFEAIRLRTALVLFEGEYSGVVKPDIHYFSLKKDFSNLDDVLLKVMDDALVLKTTERAYQDIVASGKYSYASFVHGIDRDLTQRCLSREPRRRLFGPVYVQAEDGSLRQCLPALPLSLVCAADVLDYQNSLHEIQGTNDRGLANSRRLNRKKTEAFTQLIAKSRRLFVKCFVRAELAFRRAVESRPALSRLVKFCWCRLPISLRAKLSTVLSV